jgi:cysteine desulfuration protein SufE
MWKRVMTQFGVDVTAQDILDTLSFFDSWEDRYKYLIDLGKELPSMPDSDKTDATLVRGCQSQVWVKPQIQNEVFYFNADSDAFIVKGLLCVVLAAFNGKSADAILSFDIDAYFADLDLLQHLSSTRGNGLKSMVQRIRDYAHLSV